MHLRSWSTCQGTADGRDGMLRSPLPTSFSSSDRLAHTARHHLLQCRLHDDRGHHGLARMATGAVEQQHHECVRLLQLRDWHVARLDHSAQLHLPWMDHCITVCISSSGMDMPRYADNLWTASRWDLGLRYSDAISLCHDAFFT